jgi:hypothetical protein
VQGAAPTAGRPPTIVIDALPPDQRGQRHGREEPEQGAISTTSMNCRPPRDGSDHRDRADDRVEADVGRHGPVGHVGPSDGSQQAKREGDREDRGDRSNIIAWLPAGSVLQRDPGDGTPRGAST